MASGDKVSDGSPRDGDVALTTCLKRSRFLPKMDVKGEVKSPPSSSPFPALTPAPQAGESISHADKMEPSEDSYVPRFNGVLVGATEEESSSMDAEEEEGEDVVVKEFDVFINPSIDAETKVLANFIRSFSSFLYQGFRNMGTFG